MGNLRIDKARSGGISVRFPARSWEKAHEIIESLRRSPPHGYRMKQSQVSPKSKSGRRCNLKMIFEYTDNRVDRFTMPEASLWFREFAREASVKDENTIGASQPE